MGISPKGDCFFMPKKSAASRAVVGACIALFVNMGMNSVFTIFLSSFMAEWPDASVATIALAATFGCTGAAPFRSLPFHPDIKILPSFAKTSL